MKSEFLIVGGLVIGITGLVILSVVLRRPSTAQTPGGVQLLSATQVPTARPANSVDVDPSSVTNQTGINIGLGAAVQNYSVLQ